MMSDNFIEDVISPENESDERMYRKLLGMEAVRATEYVDE